MGRMAGLDRRQFLGKGFALGSTLLGMGGIAQLVDACGGSASPAQSPSSSGSSSDWNQIVDKANSEGALNVYSVDTPAVNEALQRAFQRKYPSIRTTVNYLISPALEQRVDVEKPSNAAGADALIQSDAAYVKARDAQGYWVPLTGPNVLNPKLVNVRGPNDHYATIHLSAFGYAWNTQYVSGSPKYTDLLSPKYKGLIGLLDFTTQPSVTILVALMAELLQKQYGVADPLKQLAALSPKFYAGGQSPMLQDLVAGETHVVPEALAVAIPPGAPVKMAYPDKALALPVFASATSWSRHPNAAQVFVDYLLTRDGQQIVAKGAVSALAGVPGTVLDTSRVTVVDTSSYSKDYISGQLAAMKAAFHR